MADVDRDKMREIKAFPELVRYLQDELNWPIKPYDFENLFFEYQPDEIGIDAKSAAKIEEIKQLRPMVDGQPWGIFFVKFAPKRLPVVALRRILSSLAIKKRASSKISEMATWQLNDLLFISNYGENDQRQITFAHFSQDEQSDDLPTLRVLGWDDADTALHIDHVQNELQQKLSWPKNEKDIRSWQINWSSAFTLRHREVITTSRDLAIRLAALARQIRNRANAILAIETEAGPISKLHRAFKETLIHDLSEDDFADMYAQTIAYGLLSARLANPKGRTADELAIQVPVTNPFLKELMETFLHVGGRKGKAGGVGIDFDELGVSEVVDLLNNSDMEAVIRDFGDRNPQEDPVIHFYEHFLKEYDAKKRMQRGVFYTPRPVVFYIVRSVDEALRTEFGLEDGLADTTTWGAMATRHKDFKIPDGVPADQAFVQILDPATGTGTFLVEAIDVIYETMKKKWESEAGGPLLANVQERWNEYVPKHLLPRLHGYELLMAPYAIAHLKIGLKLYETGYRFGSDERARIYLTNSLEPPHDYAGKFDFMIPALTHEAQSVNQIKTKQRFTVVIGNPPYSGISANLQPIIRRSIDPYRLVDGQLIREKGALQFEKNLNDDYVKFIRFAESIIESTPGVLGMITNNAYLESATLRGMRAHLLGTFTKLQFLDLHGDTDKRERTNDGQYDENVFDIKHGVTVATLVRHLTALNLTTRKGAAFRTDLKALRSVKYEWLLSNNAGTIDWLPIFPQPERYLFVAEDKTINSEYEAYISITNLMNVNSTGFESGRDEVLTAFTKAELHSQLLTFCNESAHVVKKYFNVADGWGAVLFDARKAIIADPEFESRFRKFVFNPFDIRWCYYRKDLLKTNSFSAGRHLCYGPNMALIVMRQVSLDSGFSHAGIAKYIVNNRCFYSTKGKVSYLPLYLYSGDSDLVQEQGQFIGPNLRFDYANVFAQSLGLIWSERFPEPSTCDSILTATDLLSYAYAVLYSESYRNRYAEPLKRDFPRIPIHCNLSLFRNLTRLGSELIEFHLMQSPRLDSYISQYTGVKNPHVSRIGWSNDTVWLDAAAAKKGQPCTPGTVGFRGVTKPVWNFHIGGYQVCEKWLKDRKGRVLSQEDIEHYQKIIVALSETIRIMAEIDQVIENYGGWPGAFKSTAKT